MAGGGMAALGSGVEPADRGGRGIRPGFPDSVREERKWQGVFGLAARIGGVTDFPNS